MPAPHVPSRFGLQQPIRAEGTLTYRDLRNVNLFVMTTSGCRTWFLLVALGTSAVFFITLGLRANWGVDRGSMLMLGTASVFAMLVLLFVLALRRRTNRNLDRPLGPVERIMIDEDGVASQWDGGAATVQWSAHSSFRHCGDYALLYRESPTQYIVFPRRFFACDSDWETFLALLPHKLPEHGSPTAAAAESGSLVQPTPPWVEAALEPSAGAGTEPPIRFRGSIRPRELAQARRLLPRQWLPPLLVTVVVGILFVIPLTFALRSEELPARLVMSQLLALALFTWMGGKAWWKRRRERIRQEGIFAPYAGTLCETAVEIVGNRARTAFDWSSVRGYRQADAVILLHIDPPDHFRILCRSAFTEDGWQAARAMIARKAPLETKRGWISYTLT